MEESKCPILHRKGILLLKAPASITVWGQEISTLLKTGLIWPYLQWYMLDY